MNIRNNLMRYAIAMIGMVMIAACSDDDNWQAGPQVKEGCQQVHFTAGNEEMTILNSEDPNDRMVRVTVARNTDQGELTVPLTALDVSDGLEIPSEVKFEDGMSETEISVTVAGEIVKGTNYTYSLQLTGDDVDPYAELDGGSRFEGTISFPNTRDVRMWLASDYLGTVIEGAGYWTETLLDLGGGRYRFSNLMESGMMLDFTLDANNRMALSSPLWSEYEGNMYPGYYYTGDCYYWCNSWDYDNSEYVYWTFYPHGKDAYLWIEQMEMYAWPTTDYVYSYYNESEDVFAISLGLVKLNTERVSRTWGELRFRFLEDGEEPEEYLPEEAEKPETGDEVTFMGNFDYQYNTFGGMFEVKAKKIGDNGYLFEDFLGCGDDITMTIDRATGAVNFEGIYSQYWDGLFYLTASNGYGATVYPNKGATDNYINYMYFWTSDGTDYVRWNEADKAFELGTYIYLNEDYNTSYWDTLYLTLQE